VSPARSRFELAAIQRDSRQREPIAFRDIAPSMVELTALVKGHGTPDGCGRELSVDKLRSLVEHAQCPAE